MNALQGLSTQEVEELKSGFYKVLGDPEGGIDKYIPVTVIKSTAKEVKSELFRFMKEEEVSEDIVEFIKFLCTPGIIDNVKIVIDRSYFNFSALVEPRRILDLGGHTLSSKGLDKYDYKSFVKRAIELGCNFHVYLRGLKEIMEDRDMERMSIW